MFEASLQRNDLSNGYLFNQQRNYMAQQQQHLYNQGQFLFVPSGSPPPNVASPSTSKDTPETVKAAPVKNRWDNAESKILIQSYKKHYKKLSKAKSRRGKKSAWDLMYDSYIKSCTEAKIRTTKTLVQAKEKWRCLFEKYKTVVDNNKQTGRGRIDFEHFDDIDDFMGHADKVNPKFVKESGILDDDDDEDQDETTKEKGSEEEEASERPAKKTKKTAAEKDDKLFELLQKQQEAMLKSEENDRKAFETIFQMQSDAERRHQEFMLSVLGKLGDVFAKK